jgi:transcriptional regulator with XRE-family HTH domain
MDMERSAVGQKVREFRLAIGQTQQQFAQTMKTAITTIARYETSRPPRGSALVRLAQLAWDNGQREFADFFSRAFAEDMRAGSTASDFAIPKCEEFLSQDSSKKYEGLQLFPPNPTEEEVAMTGMLFTAVRLPYFPEEASQLREILKRVADKYRQIVRKMNEARAVKQMASSVTTQQEVDGLTQQLKTIYDWLKLHTGQEEIE